MTTPPHNIESCAQAYTRDSTWNEEARWKLFFSEPVYLWLYKPVYLWFIQVLFFCCRYTSISMIVPCNSYKFCPSVVDIPVYPVPVLPVTRGVVGHPVWPGHRHVEPGVYSGRDAHRRTSLRWLQRGESTPPPPPPLGLTVPANLMAM